MDEPINYLVNESPVQETVVLKKPKKPRVIQKPVPPIPAPQIEIPKQQPIQPKPRIFQKPSEIKETIGYDTLNPFLYKFINYLMLPSLLVALLSFVLVIINIVWFPDLKWSLYGGIITTVFSIVTFIILFLLSSTSLKRNDIIVIRKYRSSAGTITRTNLKGKSEIMFDRKDPSSKVLISWSGTITDPVSGCKILQISEGHPTNDNLNAQVSESEWDKDVARLTKAKSIADLAEAELFNQGLLGMKWQDIVLILIALFCLAIIVLLFTSVPSEVAKKTIEGLMNGTIQNAIQQGLAQAGILTPVPTP